MKRQKTPQERKLEFFIVLWCLSGLIGFLFISWGSVKVAELNNAVHDLATRPSQVINNVQTELQPIYTTIKGSPGPRGIAGKDSVSTVTVIHTQEQIPGPKGDTGKTGKNGADARQTEFSYDPKTNTMYSRYVGDDTWVPVTTIDGSSL